MFCVYIFTYLHAQHVLTECTEVATISFDRRCVSLPTCVHMHYNVCVLVRACISGEESIRQIDR